ncbi:MAG TPA: diacylglyceryl transferase [Flavobacteriales bacterium]|nr:diacylglyceryl transferase [Flavobacteriales bacterium]
MYPYLHDFFNEVFGLNIRLPFPMFGFWVAMAFIAAHFTFAKELRRKENEGLISAVKRKLVIGEKMKPLDYLGQGIFGFILGFKGLHAVFYYDEFVNNPPDFIFSTDGSVIGGITGAAVVIYFRYRDVKKQELQEPKEIEEEIHPYQLVGNMTLIAAVAGILGSKIFHNLENIDDFLRDPVDALLSFSGLSIYGGLIVGGLSVVYYAWRNKLKPVHVIDACAPALILAYGVGRIGCQLAGDGDRGTPNDTAMPEIISFLPDWFWAYDYPNNVIGVNLQQDFLKMGMESITGKAWPTPLYETIMSFAIFAGLWMFRKKMTVPGTMFSVYLIAIGIERFAIEKIRINPPYHLFGYQATQAEIISILLIMIGIGGLFFVFKRRKT